jgi:hypothetical protein
VTAPGLSRPPDPPNRSVLRLELTLPPEESLDEATGRVDWTLYLWPCKADPPRWERIEGGTCDDWMAAMDEATEAITENFVEGG